LALAEKDSLRRFLFAYCGLEILANKFVSRNRGTLLTELKKDLNNAPIDELVWPKMPDENAPQHNLVFAFAAMATLVSRDTADSDTVSFRNIAKARNLLAHGDADALESLPGREAIDLLQRYLGAVVAADAPQLDN
jgi:hypothetical protein